MPPEFTALVYDSDNYITIYTSTGFDQPVKGAVSPEEAVKELLKTYPPSKINVTYILISDAPYALMKRTLMAFTKANYPNISMIDNHSFFATTMICGCDFEYKEGETILCCSHIGGPPECTVPMVLKKVDQLFQIIEHIGKTIFDVMHYYPEIEKVIFHTKDRSIDWNTVFADKALKFCKLPLIQGDYALNKYRKVKAITGIRIVIKEEAVNHPIDLFYEVIPVMKTVEITLSPDINVIHVLVSHGTEPVRHDSSHKITNRPGYVTKIAVTVTIDETIIPQFTFKIVEYLPQVIHEIVFDSNDNKFSGSLIKHDKIDIIIRNCATPEDVFAAFESLPTTNYKVGTIINYKNKFNIDVHKTIMKLLSSDKKVCIMPLQTALNVDCAHSTISIENDENIAVWYQYTNTEVFYAKKCKIKSNIVCSEKNIDDRAVKKVLIVTKNALSAAMSQKMRNRFPAAKIYHSNHVTLPPQSQYEYAWQYLKKLLIGHTLTSLGTDFVVTANSNIVNVDKKPNIYVSYCTQVIPIGKTEGIVTVDMKHYALPDLVRLQEVAYGSSKNNREAVIRLSVDQHYISQVDITLQKVTAKNTEKHNEVIYTITLKDVLVEYYQDKAFQTVMSANTNFRELANYMATLAPVSSVIAVIDFNRNDISLAEGKQRRDILLAVGFKKVIPWNFDLSVFEALRYPARPENGECTAVFTNSCSQLFVRQNNNLKYLTSYENLEKFKTNGLHLMPKIKKLTDSSHKAVPRHLMDLSDEELFTTGEAWNLYWNIANNNGYILPFIDLEFAIEGTNRQVFKTGIVSLPHEFTVEIDVDTANSIKVSATRPLPPNVKKEEPLHIATFDTASLHSRTIVTTIFIENAYNITAKFKASAPGHKKRVVTRIVVIKQSENGVNRLTFSRGGKAFIADDLPSMLIALETHAHPELSCVIFATSKAHLFETQKYIELAQRFRFADVQLCHESVLEANKLLYGSDIDAEIDETMFIISSTKYFKNFNKSYVIRKESNRFKLLKEDADTIENLRKEFPDVERITYEGLNPINKNDAPGSPLQAYLFDRIDGTLRRTAVADIDMGVKITTMPFLKPKPKKMATVAPLKPEKTTLSPINPINQQPIDEVAFIVRFGTSETVYKLKKGTYKRVIVDVGDVTSVKILAKTPTSNNLQVLKNIEFIAVEGRKISFEFTVDDDMKPRVHLEKPNITFTLTIDNRIVVLYFNETLSAEYPAYISLKNETPSVGFEALADMSSHPEAVAYDLHYLLSDKFDPERPKEEWAFTTSLDHQKWIANVHLGNRIITPAALLTVLLKQVLIKEQQKITKIIDTMYFSVPMTFNMWPEQIAEIGKELGVKIEVEWIEQRETAVESPKPQPQTKRCTVM